MAPGVRFLAATLVIFTVYPACAEPDDLEKLFAIGDEAFEPVTWPLSEPAFFHRKWIRIQSSSLTDGWVHNRQCHGRFAEMPSLQIVFGKDSIRAIHIDETSHLGKAWVEGETVQLEQVRPESEICFSSENRVLTAIGNGHYELKVGPFYYRYLDGYFPMRVDLVVDFPSALLRLVEVAPRHPAITMKNQSGQVRMASLFQGKLWITVKFALAQDPLSDRH